MRTPDKPHVTASLCKHPTASRMEPGNATVCHFAITTISCQRSWTSFSVAAASVLYHNLWRAGICLRSYSVEAFCRGRNRAVSQVSLGFPASCGWYYSWKQFCELMRLSAGGGMLPQL
jgi:hypothetical protein